MRQRVRAAWLFLAPMLVVLAVVAAWPLLAHDLVRLHRRHARRSRRGASSSASRNYLDYVDDGDGTGDWFGLLADPVWWHAVRNTIWFAVISVTIETILGLVVALVLNAEFPGRGLSAPRS